MDKNQKAMEVAENFFSHVAHRELCQWVLLYATKLLLVNGQYQKCDALLATLKIIPFEGATGGRVMYRESKTTAGP
jgi:hypothetical protein